MNNLKDRLMNRLGLFIIIIIVSIFYLFYINIYATIDFSQNIEGFNNEQIIDGGTNVIIGMSDDVSVSVTRDRWYGTIIENGDTKNLYFFDKIKLPLLINGINYVLYHIVFLILMICSILIYEFQKKKVMISG